jgi:hypothetical protein
MKPSIPLEAVLTTRELATRPPRPPDYDIVTTTFRRLRQNLLDSVPNSPENILQKSAELLLSLCDAGTAGFSILEEERGQRFLRWHAIAGVYEPYRWGIMPADNSPCGVVLNTEAVQMFANPERHFRYTVPLNPPIYEALLVPFRTQDMIKGTGWIIAHDESRKFDNEDLRRLDHFVAFTSDCYTAVLYSQGMRSDSKIEGGKSPQAGRPKSDNTEA